MARLLIIEDEAVLAKNIQRTLQKSGHSVAMASSADEGETRFKEFLPDLTLLDLRLPDGNGLDLLPRLKAEDPLASVVIMTAYATVEDAVRALQLGARDYLQKPISMQDLRHRVKRMLEEKRLREEVSYYRARDSSGARLESLLGVCEPIVQLRARLRRLFSLPITAAPPTVLIHGETGTGKGMVARILHCNGPRASLPFVEVNCGAIPETLVEAELFGYRRGAFTDAKISRTGLFQAADQGTLFLDEIGCLALATQVKVLKAIEEKTIRPLGSSAREAIDVQIIAATNSDLQSLVRQAAFREDLYYRLQVVTLTVPSLRERGEDILLLAREFTVELCARYRQRQKTLTRRAENALRRYRWPGNVRELFNTLDRAVLFSDTETIDAPALGLPVEPPTVRLCRPHGDELQIEIPDEGVRFEEIERALIVSGLRKARGRQSEAARLLGMSRDTLRYRIEKFGINPKPYPEP